MLSIGYMHNLSTAERLLREIEENFADQLSSINHIIIGVGRFSTIRSQHLDNAFEILTTSFPFLRHISITYKTTPGELHCLDCDYQGEYLETIHYPEVHGIELSLTCPKCQSWDILLIEGTGIELISIN